MVVVCVWGGGTSTVVSWGGHWWARGKEGVVSPLVDSGGWVRWDL